MRKFILLAMAVVTVFSLSACYKEDNSTPLPTGELVLLADSSLSNPNHFATEEGYYYFTSDMHLMYIDYNTAKEIYLCTDSSCRHDTEACSASFQDGFGFDSQPFVWNGKLYCLNRDFDNEGSTMLTLGGDDVIAEPEAKNDTLYCMNLDGTGREKVFTFPQNQSTEKYIMGDGDDLWFITKELENKTEDGMTYTSSANRQLVKYSISSKQITDTISLDFGDSAYYSPIGCEGTKLVLFKTVYPDGMSEEDAMKLSQEEWLDLTRNSTVHYVSFDIVTKSMEELYSFENSGLRSTGFVSEGYLYLSDCSSGNIMKINVTDGEQKVLCSTDKSYIYMVTEDALCCLATGISYDNDYYFIDKVTGEIKHSTLKLKNLGWLLEMHASTDDKLLVVNEYVGKSKADGSVDVSAKKFALITKDDMYNSRENYIPIDMAGDGQ